ncbi:MAG: type II secretion system protein GspG, partial [Phycisphaerales bacterium]|nr:type II secretion system protein GspG [Phycisphaerales bacterium]
FTLIEVMVVVVIIGLLAGAVALKVSDHVDKARVARAKSDISTIMTAVESFYLDNSRYPSNDEGLGVLAIQTTLDPWKRPYQFNAPGREGPYEIICYGADGLSGGDGINRDIVSSELDK